MEKTDNSQEGHRDFWEIGVLGKGQKEALPFQTFSRSHHCLEFKGRRLVIYVSRAYF